MEPVDAKHCAMVNLHFAQKGLVKLTQRETDKYGQTKEIHLIDKDIKECKIAFLVSYNSCSSVATFSNSVTITAFPQSVFFMTIIGKILLMEELTMKFSMIL